MNQLISTKAPERIEMSEKLRTIYTNVLNELHKTDYSTRFWGSLIGDYIRSVLSIKHILESEGKIDLQADKYPVNSHSVRGLKENFKRYLKQFLKYLGARSSAKHVEKLLLSSDSFRLDFSLLDIHLDDLGVELPAVFKTRGGNRKLRKKLKDVIECVNVSYSFPNSDEQAIRDVWYTIPRGHVIGFVGESGAGKSPIVDLLLGLMKPASGEIQVDRRNIHENLSAWQEYIGYIPQSIYLADETLRSNVAFGLSEKEIDDEKVLRALELAQLRDVIDRLPDGLDTILGEHGICLSEGQKQRVGIDRALYHDTEVLVMDEATSGTGQHHGKGDYPSH